VDEPIELEYKDINAQISVLADPERMNRISGHLCAGGTLIDYCRLVGMTYLEVHKWIVSDESRLAQYEAAKVARQEWLFERVLSEYKALSMFEITDLYGESGELRPMSEWSESARAAVAKVETLEQFEMVDGVREAVGEIKKVAVWDKTKTLEALGKYLKMFRDQIDINITGELSIRGALDEAESRLRSVRSIDDAIEVEVEQEAEEPI